MSYKTSQTLEKDETTGDVVLRENGQKINGTAASRDVTTSATDTTAGRLMRVGDFGLGVSQASQVDPDTITTNGIHTINTVPSIASSGSQVLHWQTGGDAFQLVARRDNENIFVRSKNAGVWKDWHPLYNAANILGTVSQSGGVPTGSIIERGSNANGDYVKFADGTMFCFGQFNVADITILGSGTFDDPYRSTNSDVIFPTTFANVSPTFSCLVRANTTSHFEKIYLCGYTKILFDRAESLMVYRYGNSSSTIVPVLHWQAIGRWY